MPDKITQLYYATDRSLNLLLASLTSLESLSAHLEHAVPNAVFPKTACFRGKNGMTASQVRLLIGPELPLLLAFLVRIKLDNATK